MIFIVSAWPSVTILSASTSPLGSYCLSLGFLTGFPGHQHGAGDTAYSTSRIIHQIVFSRAGIFSLMSMLMIKVQPNQLMISLVGRTCRRNNDGRATRSSGLVETDRIGNRIRRHPFRGRRRAPRSTSCQSSRRRRSPPSEPGGRSHTIGRHQDAASSSLPPPSSVFQGGPCTLAHDRKSRTVDEERHAGTRGGATKWEVEMLATP